MPGMQIGETRSLPEWQALVAAALASSAPPRDRSMSHEAIALRCWTARYTSDLDVRVGAVL